MHNFTPLFVRQWQPRCRIGDKEAKSRHAAWNTGPRNDRTHCRSNCYPLLHAYWYLHMDMQVCMCASCIVAYMYVLFCVHSCGHLCSGCCCSDCCFLCHAVRPLRSNYFNKFKPQRNNKQFVFRLKCNFHNFLYKAGTVPFVPYSPHSFHTHTHHHNHLPPPEPSITTYFIYSTASCALIFHKVFTTVQLFPRWFFSCMCWQAFIMHFPIYFYM